MLINDNLSVNAKGHLEIGGIDSLELIKEYGTPLYIMDEELIRDACRMYKNSIEQYYNGQGLVCYASKAFSCKQMYRIAAQEGIGVDVVSAGELYTAMSVGFDSSKMCYHGNNKTKSDLIYALECRVGRIVVDSLTEIDMLDSLCCERGIKANILLRITPGIDAHTHSFIKTGQLDSKYGFPIETGMAMQTIKAILTKTHLKLEGIHCHIGSQIFDLEPFEHAAEVMLSFIAAVKDETGYELATLNLGGGFGIKYVESDQPLSYDSYMKSISNVAKATAQKLGIGLPYIIIEPGRSIVGQAGTTLYQIGNVKVIPDVRTYVSIDGGMTDNIRFALYESEYDFVVANKADKPKTMKVAIAGRCCESGDLLAKETLIQECEAGDYLATLSTGAYNYSMSSNYNRNCKPPVVFIKDKKSYIGVKGETFEDITRNDV